MNYEIYNETDNETFTENYSNHQLAKATGRSHHEPVRVLIVDDDVDAILPIDAMFRSLGCSTSFALASKDAAHDVASGLYDLIVLDWYMDQTTGAMIMERAQKTINRFRDHRYLVQGFRPRVVTYSGLKQSQIWLPESSVFVHQAHWRKPISMMGLRSRAADLVHEIELLKGQS